MHFMLQKEVVDRMAAGPGSKVYGRLSVMLQAYCRVDAAVQRAAGRVPAAAEGRFRGRAAGAARRADEIGDRRSQALSSTSCATPSASAARPCATRCNGVADSAMIEAAGLRPDARAEQVDVAGFIRLAEPAGRLHMSTDARATLSA